MSARAEFGPLSCEEVEQNRRHSLGLDIECAKGSPATAAFAISLAERGPDNGWLDDSDSLQNHRSRLQKEIQRGKDYLETIRKELAESRRLMENWPTDERYCGRNPLPQIVQSMTVSERIEEFLPNWLKRREEKLAAITKELEMFDHQNGSELSEANMPPVPLVNAA